MHQIIPQSETNTNSKVQNIPYFQAYVLRFGHSVVGPTPYPTFLEPIPKLVLIVFRDLNFRFEISFQKWLEIKIPGTLYSFKLRN